MNLLLLAALVEWAGWHYLLAAAVSIEASTLWNYVLNRAWTWRDRDRSWWSLLSYHGVVAVGLAAQWATIAVGTGVLGFHYLLTAAVGIGLGTTWNFLANHRITFQAYTLERRRRHLRVASYVGAVILYLAVAVLLTHDWDTFVFQRSVEEFVANGRTPYETATEAPAYTFSNHALPVQQLWYAYPPLPLLFMAAAYGPALSFGVATPWLARVLVKAPFLLANLALAATARRMVRTAPDATPISERRADRLERWLLFNPLLVIVAAVWGQFESAIVLLLLLSFLALRTGRHATAGAAWGLACLIKPFPVLLGPLLLGHLVRRAGFRAAVQYFATGAAVFAAVGLPFLFGDPHGYVNQIFLLHAERAPSGFGVIPFLYEAARWSHDLRPGLLPGDASLIELGGLLSVSLTAFAVLFVTFGLWAKPATERSLLFGSGAVFVAAFLFSKTVHEQYIVMPVALLLIALVHPGRDPLPVPTRRIRGVLVCTSLLLPLALTVNALHFIMFIPEDVLAFIFGTTRPDALAAVAATFGVAVSEFANAAAVVTGCLLVPLLIAALRFVVPMVEHGVAAAVATAVALVRRVPAPPATARLTLVAAVLLLLVPSVAMGAIAPRQPVPDTDAGVVDTPTLLVEYRTDWFNPTHRPEIPAGSWSDVAITPQAGYYHPNAFKIQRDLLDLRDRGVSGIVIPVDPRFEPAAGTLFHAAEYVGMPHALRVDLAALAGTDGQVGFTSQTARQLAELLDGPTLGYHDGDYHMRTGPDQGRLLIVTGVDRVAPTFSMPEQRFVTDALADATLESGSGAADRLVRLAPESQEQLNGTGAAADAWRAAYEEASVRWWAQAFGWLDNGTRLHVLADGPIPVPTSLRGQLHVDVGVPSVLSAPPGDSVAYDQAWRDVIDEKADLVVVPWNSFDRGQGIEPTREHGDRLLVRTELWFSAYRGLGAAATTPTTAFLDGGTAA